MTFENLNLNTNIIKSLNEVGYSEPTEIQKQAIPEILSGSDVRASAQTGTGKTAAFLLPALNRLAQPSNKSGKGPRILILVPTRELAMQIAGQAEKYSKYLEHTRTVCIVGGVPYPVQNRKLSRYYDVLIATPGRLLDFIHQKKINFSRLEALVLDEADRMLDMGFVEPVEEIVSATPPSRQTLLFSATMGGSVIKLSKRLMKDPKEIVVHAKQTRHENIEQKLYHIDDLGHKNRLLEHILIQGDIENAIVFTSTKRHAEQLVGELYDKGHLAAALHGDMSQRQRTRTISQLRNGKVRVLVATDVASRGIDVQSISHVINFDLPQNAEDYVHRIGRTGRAGAKGTALSFAGGRDSLLLKRIEEFTGQQIAITTIPGLEPSKKKRPSSRPKNSKARKPNQWTKGKPKARKSFGKKNGRKSRPHKARARNHDS